MSNAVGTYVANSFLDPAGECSKLEGKSLQLVPNCRVSPVYTCVYSISELELGCRNMFFQPQVLYSVDVGHIFH